MSYDKPSSGKRRHAASRGNAQEQSACPAGQKQHVGFGESSFAIAPRNLFDDDRLAATTIDAPHGVEQKNQKSPERNKLETSFGELITSRVRADGNANKRPWNPCADAR